MSMETPDLGAHTQEVASPVPESEISVEDIVDRLITSYRAIQNEEPLVVSPKDFSGGVEEMHDHDDHFESAIESQMVDNLLDFWREDVDQSIKAAVLADLQAKGQTGLIELLG